MVSRHQNGINRDAVVVDLDGTLITTNSFREFLHYAMSECCRRHRFACAAKISAYSTLRLMRVVSHAWMKRRVMIATAAVFDENDMRQFAESLKIKINQTLLAELSRLRNDGHPIYLASAAPQSYSHYIGQMLEFDGVVATPQPLLSEPLVEARGIRKLDWTLNLLTKNDCRLWRVYTDHIDDLPIMTAAPELILVNPNEKTIRAVKKAAIRYRLISG